MADRSIPAAALGLGLAGLFPQAAAVLAIVGGGMDWRFQALAFAFAYAALILSFLGGLWWGLAAAAGDRAPGWVYGAAIVPSLFALATCLPWLTGDSWPGPSLILLGLGLVAALAVDARLVRLELAPAWWMRLRLMLSGGLGALTLAAGLLGGETVPAA